MAYPEPIFCEDQEMLFKQACFFWKEYEKVKKERDAIKLIWQCQKCGRVGNIKFYEHAPSKDSMACCLGKVKKIKMSEMW